MTLQQPELHFAQRDGFEDVVIISGMAVQQLHGKRPFMARADRTASLPRCLSGH